MITTDACSAPSSAESVPNTAPSQLVAEVDSPRGGGRGRSCPDSHLVPPFRPGRHLGPHHAHPPPRRRHRLRDNRSAGGAYVRSQSWTPPAGFCSTPL